MLGLCRLQDDIGLATVLVTMTPEESAFLATRRHDIGQRALKSDVTLSSGKERDREGT